MCVNIFLVLDMFKKQPETKNISERQRRKGDKKNTCIFEKLFNSRRTAQTMRFLVSNNGGRQGKKKKRQKKRDAAETTVDLERQDVLKLSNEEEK